VSRLPIDMLIDPGRLTYAKNNGVPQRAQKPRSAAEELRNLVGSPRVQAKFSIRTFAHAVKGPPTDFWHMRQWQMPARSGSLYNA
jgi:hypothetical protein